MKKMMNSRQADQTKKALVLTLVMVLLAGCGSSKSTDSGSDDFASRATPNDVITGTEKAWAYCNEGSAKNSSFKFSMKYYSEGGQIRNDLMNLRITSAPSDFKSTNNYFQLFRWQVSPTNSTYIDTTPLKFRVVDPTTGTTIIQSQDFLRWSEISSYASKLGITDATTLLRRLKLIVDVRDQLGQFDVMRVVYYSSATNSEKDRSDALLPVFRADPDGYATESDGQARSSILRNLHPFLGRNGQGWSVKDFQTWANGYCSPM